MRILFATMGSRGDVQPYIALAKRAIKMGHSATICTGKSFEDLITSSGVEFKEISSDLNALLDDKNCKKILNNPFAHPIYIKKLMKNTLTPNYEKSLFQIWEIAQNSDILIYHPKVFGIVDMSIKLGIKAVCMPPVPCIYPIDEFPNIAVNAKLNFGKTINKLTYSLMSKAEMSNIKQVNLLREKALGFPPRKAGKYYLKQGDNNIPIIYPISKYLFPDVKSWDNKVNLTGFFFDENSPSLDNKITDFISNGKVPIAVSFSSMPLKNPDRFLTNFKKALENTDNRAIILTGKSGIDFENSDRLLKVESAPHLALFPLCKSVIHHGGVGTTAAALKSGKPQLIIPFSVDQPFWAKKIHNLGCALKPITEKQCDSQTLSNLLINLENPAIIQKSKEFSELINSENGTENAIHMLETLIK